MNHKQRLEELVKREAEKYGRPYPSWKDSEQTKRIEIGKVDAVVSGGRLFLEPLAIALEALDLIDKELTCPAAEYVPAMQECFKIKDKALERIEKLLK